VKKKKTKNNKNQAMSNGKKGFTLIEVVLVLVLVGGVFLAIYGIFSKTIANDDESFHEVVGSNLAQEGVELMRNQRDENILNDDDFYDGVDGNAQSGNICTDGDSYVSLSSCSGAFPTATPYERTCSVNNTIGGIVSGDGEDAIAVSCVVEWTGIAGIDRKARAMAILTNWQELP
jgi:prepilin-type N-terminal cleavage/methylation domain-containing protein